MTEVVPFHVLMEQLQTLMKLSLDGKRSVDDIVRYTRTVSVLDGDNLRQIVDQATRNVLSFLLKSGLERGPADELIKLSIALAVEEACSGSLPGLLFCDMFDSLPIKESEEFFSLVEDKVKTWKEELFFKNCKNQLLRTCNDLLRRLSRSQNTVFCGRILVFLANLFPLSERSGLNIISEFNSENITLFSSEDYKGMLTKGTSDDGLEEGETDDTGSTAAVSVDYNLYRKFWSLQEYFRQPTLCYNKVHWRQFTSYSMDVLSVFGSFKLDDVKTAEWTLPESASCLSGKSVYFAKYLTSQKLLELELSDSNFRRSILVQFLILIHYLQATVRFKQETHVLTEEQSTWVKNTTSLVYKLLEEIPPDGAGFAAYIKHILQREEFWNNWKNEGCPDFKEATPVEVVKESRPKRKLGDEIKAALASKKVILGNPEMNRLWNLYPDNWEACMSPKRDFVPSLEKFFETAVEQADPAQGIENRHKNVYEGNFGWRSLRLLSQKSPHFFTSSNQPIKSLPLYLESMVGRLAKELPLNTQSSSASQSVDDKADEADYGADDSEDELLKSNEEESTNSISKEPDPNQDVLSKEQLLELAAALASDWIKLAPLLKFSEDEVLYFSSEHEGDAVKQAHQALLVWVEQEPQEATADALLHLAEEVGLREKLEPLLTAPQ